MVPEADERIRDHRQMAGRRNRRRVRRDDARTHGARLIHKDGGPDQQSHRHAARSPSIGAGVSQVCIAADSSSWFNDGNLCTPPPMGRRPQRLLRHTTDWRINDDHICLPSCKDYLHVPFLPPLRFPTPLLPDLPLPPLRPSRGPVDFEFGPLPSLRGMSSSYCNRCKFIGVRRLCYTQRVLLQLSCNQKQSYNNGCV